MPVKRKHRGNRRGRRLRLCDWEKCGQRLGKLLYRESRMGKMKAAQSRHAMFVIQTEMDSVGDWKLRTGVQMTNSGHPRCYNTIGVGALQRG